MKYFFLIQIAISILLAGSLFLTHDPSPTQTTLFQDKITTIQSSREKLIQYYKKKINISKNKKNSSRQKPYRKKSENHQKESPQSKFEMKIIDAGLKPELLSMWLPHKQLSAIHYRKYGQEPLIIKNFSFSTSGSQARILQLSSREAIEETKEQRAQDSDEQNKKDNKKKDDLQKLSAKSFKVISFIPGKQDNGKPITKPNSYAFSLRGPDHYYDDIDPSNTAELKKLRQRTISLGHGGEITLQVTQDGVILNKNGPDFAIFENPLILSPDLVYQEFASVGVALENKPEAYRWFPCQSQKSILKGCAGIVPASDGGDLFDLSALELDKIRFIKIKDLGTNLSNFGKNTEGFDLDSLTFIHAYKELPPAETEDEIDESFTTKENHVHPN